MRIAGLLVAVGDDHLRTLTAEHLHEATDGFVEVGLCEAPRIVVRLGVGHARVAVAEHDELVVADDPGRGRDLVGADLPEVLADLRAIHDRVVDVAFLTAGAADEHGVHTLGVVAGDRRRALRRLVVGMRVDGE